MKRKRYTKEYDKTTQEHSVVCDKSMGTRFSCKNERTADELIEYLKEKDDCTRKESERGSIFFHKYWEMKKMHNQISDIVEDEKWKTY